MDWTQVLAIIGGNAAIFIPMFLWLQKEANINRRDIINILIEIKNDMKDFHDRLCAIEERKLKKD